jgi:hypothetical protein
MHVRDGAPAGLTTLNLVPAVNPTGRREYRTEAADALGTFVLHPAVTSSNDAGVDGRVLVPTPLPLAALDTQPLQQPMLVATPVPLAPAALPSTFDISVVESRERELAPALAEHVFSDLERTGLLAIEERTEQFTAQEVAEIGDATWAGAHDLALVLTAEGKSDADWVPEGVLRHLRQLARRGGKPRFDSLLDDMSSELEGADQSGMEAFFASEAAKNSK